MTLENSRLARKGWDQICKIDIRKNPACMYFCDTMYKDISKTAFLMWQKIPNFLVTFKECNFDLAEVGIKTGAAG